MELYAFAILLFIQNMRRAYAIRPYSMLAFPATFDYNLGPSSHPRMASGVEPHPGSNQILVYPHILGWRAESSHILVHTMILVHPHIPSILVQTNPSQIYFTLKSKY